MKIYVIAVYGIICCLVTATGKVTFISILSILVKTCV